MLIRIGFQIYNIREINDPFQKILEKEIFTTTAEARFYNQPFISIPYESHHISGAIGLIESLENHLLRCNIFCLLYTAWKYKYAFSLQLF